MSGFINNQIRAEDIGDDSRTRERVDENQGENDLQMRPMLEVRRTRSVIDIGDRRGRWTEFRKRSVIEMRRILKHQYFHIFVHYILSKYAYLHIFMCEFLCLVVLYTFLCYLILSL